MTQSLDVTNIKNEPTESTSSDRTEISSNMKMNTIKQENTYVIHNDLGIKIESQEDENEFLVTASTCTMCSSNDMEIKMDEPIIKIEYENMLDELVQDPLDVRDVIKGEEYVPDLNEEPRTKTESHESASNLHDQLLFRNKSGHKDKKYTCNVCNKLFTYKHHLDQHLRIHTDEKPYTCSVCEKSFIEKGNLDRHMLIHSDEKPHVCDICQKAFNQKANLNQHKLFHSGVKSFLCKECNKSFAQKISLVKHRRIHSGEKPFACDVCEKTFADKSTLTKHKRTHTGEKPYTCDICKKSFTQKPNLDRHKKTHNN